MCGKYQLLNVDHKGRATMRDMFMFCFVTKCIRITTPKLSDMNMDIPSPSILFAPQLVKIQVITK